MEGGDSAKKEEDEFNTGVRARKSMLQLTKSTHNELSSRRPPVCIDAEREK
jgi:hypothetical protein